MNFKKFLLWYVIVWCVILGAISVWEWNQLKNFQALYEVEADDNVPGILNDTGVAGKGQNVAEVATYTKEFVADSTMSVLVNNQIVTPCVAEEFEDGIYSVLGSLTGKTIVKNKYVLELKESDVLTVTDGNGKEILPVGDDYVAGTYVENEELSKAAISLLETYLRYVNGLEGFEQMENIMRAESDAYKAVRSARESLKWVVPATEISFVEETTEAMQVFDEEHFACDVSIDLTKKANSSSGREYVVDEHVHFRVLCEKVNGRWWLYTFWTK